MVVKKGVEAESFMIKVQGRPMVTELRDLRLISVGRQADQGMAVQEQPYFWIAELPTAAWVLLGCVGMVLALIARKFIVRALSRRRERKRLESLRRSWEQIFQKANERLDYEDIYLKREEWSELTKSDTSKFEAFCHRIRPHLYKPEWNELEMNDVRTAFGQLKELIGGAR